MPIIKLHTQIDAPIQRCFDLSRSIDLHKISTSRSQEEAITGVTSGLIGLNETVTWRAKHFGVFQQLSTKITEFHSPHKFTDEMVEGIFKSFKHEHLFRELDRGTEMTDIFNYVSPFTIIGSLADLLFLKNYMTGLLKERNAVIKTYAESDKWRELLTTE